MTRTNDGTHFGPRSGCCARKASKAAASNCGALPELEGDHDPVADGIVGHRVHRDRAHVGMTGDDRLDGRGGEVLAVDAQPFVRPAREVEPAVGVAVREVARPVPAVAEAGLRRLLVPVVTLEAGRGRGLDDLADRLVEVGRSPVGTERHGRALVARLGIEHLHRRFAGTERAFGHRRVATDDDDALRRPVAVADGAAEAARELADVAVRRFVAEREPQRIVGVVGLLGCGEDVVQDLAGVGEHRHAVAADVGQACSTPRTSGGWRSGRPR